MHLSDQGLALIKQFEGFSATPYPCPAGVWTIGYGHAIKKTDSFPNGCVTQDEAAALLRADCAVAEAAVTRYVSIALTQCRFDALTSFTFNTGAGTFAGSTLRRVVNRGWHAEVPSELARWVYGGGKKLPGLVARRAAEGRMYAGVAG